MSGPGALANLVQVPSHNFVAFANTIATATLRSSVPVRFHPKPSIHLVENVFEIPLELITLTEFHISDSKPRC